MTDPTLREEVAKALHDESADVVGCPLDWEQHDERFKERTRRQAQAVIDVVMKRLKPAP